MSTIGDAIRAHMRPEEDPKNLSTGQALGPISENGEPCCYECDERDGSKVLAKYIALQIGVGAGWRFLCAADRFGWEEGDPRILVFELKPDTSVPQPVKAEDPEPAPFRMILYGRCLAVSVEGGPIDGHHLQVEVPSSKYPWRLGLTEGSRSGRPAVWHFPLHGPIRSGMTSAGAAHVFDAVHPDEAGRFVGKPLRFTIEIDPEAKY